MEEYTEVAVDLIVCAEVIPVRVACELEGVFDVNHLVRSMEIS